MSIVFLILIVVLLMTIGFFLFIILRVFKSKKEFQNAVNDLKNQVLTRDCKQNNMATTISYLARKNTCYWIEFGQEALGTDRSTPLFTLTLKNEQDASQILVRYQKEKRSLLTLEEAAEDFLKRVQLSKEYQKYGFCSRLFVANSSKEEQAMLDRLEAEINRLNFAPLSFTPLNSFAENPKNKGK